MLTIEQIKRMENSLDKINSEIADELNVMYEKEYGYDQLNDIRHHIRICKMHLKAAYYCYYVEGSKK